MADATYTELNIGQIRPTPKGTWSATQAYDYLNIVSYTDGAYICIALNGAPIGISVTDTAYWQCLAKNGKDANEFTFATETDYTNKDATKPLNSSLMNPKLTTIDRFITALSTAITSLEANFTPDGKANDAELLGGKYPDHYDCSGGCSWTCGAGCTGSCNNSCTGTCMAGCTGGCTSCTGTCIGSCSLSCTGGCSGCSGCTGGCTKQCDSSQH